MRSGGSDAGRADLHTVFGGEAAQVVQLCLLHLHEEVVALVAGPRQVGLGRLYALEKSCGESVHAAPPRPGSVGRWHGGVPGGKGRSRLPQVPGAPGRARLRCRTPAPALHKRIARYRMVLRHMQSVIAGCKPVLPPLPFRETSPVQKFSYSRPGHPILRPDPAYSRLMAEKGRMEVTLHEHPCPRRRPEALRGWTQEGQGTCAYSSSRTSSCSPMRWPPDCAGRPWPSTSCTTVRPPWNASASTTTTWSSSTATSRSCTATTSAAGSSSWACPPGC
ncbi:protein of unknown function [Streptomyces murinus]